MLMYKSFIKLLSKIQIYIKKLFKEQFLKLLNFLFPCYMLYVYYVILDTENANSYGIY